MYVLLISSLRQNLNQIKDFLHIIIASSFLSNIDKTIKAIKINQDVPLVLENYQKHLISIIHRLKRVCFHILQDIILYELRELWGKEGHKTFTALYLFYFYKNLENLYLK